MITDYDLFTGGREFKFSVLTVQTAAAGDNVLQDKSVDSQGVTIQLVLQTTSSLFSGLTTTKDSDFSGVPGEDAIAGTLTIAAAVPEPSTWAVMIVGFC